MVTDGDKAAMRRIPLEIYNEGRLDVADEVFAADYVEHIPLPPNWPAGIPGLQQFVQVVRGAFPDFQYTIDDEITEGDKYVLRVTAQGTQTGEFLGIPPSGKRATWSEIHIARVQDGKLLEHWAVLDQLGMLQQLGAIPTPG